ncbi:MAG TPA: Wzz/FepE/Etk N-terminal domain-containing protein [Terriglobales bacterium]|nr:Wzz/FepE/Etk N-terminal domain-containing protein [Terriglobales bacterium]
MLPQRELTFEDYLQMVRRRIWWLLIPAALGVTIAYGVSRVLPTRYTSQTLVLVEQQKVPDSLVRPVITEVLDERLATMKEQILSRTRLQPIIEMFGLFGDKKNLSMEDKVELMRKAISVSPVRADFGGGGLPGFYVSFTASTPHLAQQVCGEITSMFLAENLKIREQRAQGTTDFIGSQLDDAKQKLDEQDQKLADFKRKYMGQLPGQEQTNFNMLASLNSQLDSNTQALSQLEQNRTYTESVLSQQLQSWRALQDNRSVAANPETLDQQLATEQAQLSALESKYTDTHPDVIRLKQDIERVKSRIAEQGTATGKPATTVDKIKGSGPEPSQIQQLRAQLRGIEQSIQNKQAEQARIQSQINVYQARVQLSPVVEEQYKQITRDHETALQFYNDLLRKQNESEMATDLEKRQQGEQFTVLDPPNLPERPTFPNRPMFAAGGFFGGLLLGCGLAFLLETKQKLIRNENDVTFYLELPVLTRVPSVDEVRKNGNGVSGPKRDKQLTSIA